MFNATGFNLNILTAGGTTHDLIVNCYNATGYDQYGYILGTSFTANTFYNYTVILSETAYNVFSFYVYQNSNLIYSNTTGIIVNFNGIIVPYMCEQSSYGQAGLMYHANQYSFSYNPNLIQVSITNTRFFSGFVGTIISNIWTTLQALPLYISQVITNILSGFPQVISSIKVYLQCIINQISQVVTKIYSGIVTYIANIHTLFKVGYKTGIAYVTIYILNPLKTAISQVVFFIKTGIINFISAITTYIYNTGIIPPNQSTLPISYLVVLFILLIPAILIRYISNMLVLPVFDFMAIVCFAGGQISVFSLIFVIIASIPLMLNSEGDEI